MSCWPKEMGGYERACARCGEWFWGKTRTALFTVHAWHLREVHFPDWGKP